MEKRKCEECKRTLRIRSLVWFKGRELCRECMKGRNVKTLKKSSNSKNK